GRSDTCAHPPKIARKDPDLEALAYTRNTGGRGSAAPGRMVGPRPTCAPPPEPSGGSTMSIKRNPIALNLPKVVALLIVFARHVVEMMTKNIAIFASPTIALGLVSQHVDDLFDAEVLAQTRAKGTAQARDDKKAVVIDDLFVLKTYVQSICRLNQAIALTVI